MATTNNITMPERRYFDTGVQIRKLEEGESRTIEGYAFKYDSRSRKIMGWFYETIQRGFLDNLSLNEMDIVALFNHSDNLILARTISKTLNIENDEIGLRYWFEAPNNTVGNDLLESVRRGDVQHSSFSFSLAVGGDKWTVDENGDEIRTLVKASCIYDVSPVVTPAYLDTTVAKRSYDEFLKTNKNTLQHTHREMARRKFQLTFNQKL